MSAPAWIAETRARYESSGLAARLTPGRCPALVVVDLQLGFTDPAYAPGSDLDAVVAATRRLLDRARARQLTVVFTAISFSSAQLEELVWLRKMPALRDLRAGDRATELDPRLGHRAGETVLTKQAPSAFHRTGLAELLEASTADSLIVCGATTSGCVRATVNDACSKNWPTFVAAECVGDRAAGPHEANLLDIDAKYADVVDLEGAEALIGSVVAR